MAPYLPSVASIASILALAPSALAGFAGSGIGNVAVYWGKEITSASYNLVRGM